MTTPPSQQLLSGWGRADATRATVVHVPSSRAVDEVVVEPVERGLVARGLGRSYNDAAQNAGGTVVRLDDHRIDVDRASGVATVEAGVSLDALMRAALPMGWFVPVTPGTRHVTLGGAVAADVHGKNHHAIRAIGPHVLSLVLDAPIGRLVLRPDGDALERSRFWATVGGMGLTGVIRTVTLQMVAVQTSLMKVDTLRTDDLDSTLARLADDRSTYSVAWVDALATGGRLGRSVITVGEHASWSDLPAADRYRTSGAEFGGSVSVPVLPFGLVGQVTSRAFNELRYRTSPRRRVGELQSIGTFFHPLDGVGHWNRLYGPRGMLQWQCAVPFGAERVIRLALETLAGHGLASPVVVMKRFGASDDGPLSFPMPGLTLTVDVPCAAVSDGMVLDRLDHAVVAAGGRLYLAKDFRMRPELLPDMYPRLDEWREATATLDPHGRMCSDLCRRLDLTGQHRTGHHPTTGAPSSCMTASTEGTA